MKDPVVLVALILSGDFALLCWANCVTEDVAYICTSMPSSFPSHLSSVLLFVKDMGEINSSVLQSANLASVTSLTMVGGISTIHPEALYSFSQLTRLNLNDNNLSEISSDWLRQPSLLMSLTVSGNRLQVLHESMLRNFSGLRSLNLSQNVIHTIMPGTFRSQGDLARLDLSGNKLTFISAEVFLQLHSTRILLHHNPWDCSCQAVASMQLIKELVSTSRLEREMDVVCATPAQLRGWPVWNVSECLPPWASIPQGDQPPPTSLPILVGLIVLGVLLCAACLLFGLYKWKWEKNQVKPHVDKGRDSLKSQQTGVNLKGRGPSDPTRSTGGKTRAKSAGAVLCIGQSDQQVSRTGNQLIVGQPRVWHHQNPAQGAETSPSEQTHAMDQGEETHLAGAQHDTSRESSLLQETEKLPYLIIGQEPAEQSTEPQGVRHGSRPRVNRKAISRMSTWPPTSAEWKKQHACRKEALNFSPVDFDNSINKRDADQRDFSLGSSDGDSQVNVDRPPAGGDIGDPPEDSYWPVVKTDILNFKGDIEKNDTAQPKEPGSQTQSAEANISPAQESCDVLQQIHGCQPEFNEAGRKGIKNQTARCPSSGSGAEISDHYGGSSFRSLPTHSSPADKKLLQGNEYAFINLLQEVVENQGRWTRDRWKQTHLNRQKGKAQKP
ncbi:uncharacterized protein LOC125712367 [Brienomyrus brachyistius]|uniref:uncharacterized protein LOC125712367 n=1 Tax=Brienomyrus brachyistius TaxID=42636 RepID=UPI0020B3ED5B|nr:uncharacterized protein LOC125712367 [Brienomyrus brachyistius]